MVKGHPIRVAAQRTGLSSHLIRIWERRYGAVNPQRTDTNRRLFSDAEIRRLQLLRQATKAGESIGQIATLSDSELTSLVDSLRHLGETIPVSNRDARAERMIERVVNASHDAIDRLDPEGLGATLLEASVELSQPLLLEKVLDRLMHEVGEKWRRGELRVVQEHLTSAVVRSLLGSLMGAAPAAASAPRIVVATPIGQQHEFGALIATITATSHGWRPLYLGPSLPAEDIAAAVTRSGAAAVALSLIYPGDDPTLATELRRLRKVAGPDLPLLVGGRVARQYRTTLREVEAILIGDLQQFADELDRIRDLHLSAS
jgi:DNA-binding transcriptional MerR regulator/methylmalonyl-CoA mutase cobalamin-binding subunit